MTHTAKTFVRQLNTEIDYCVAEAETQGWRGDPRDYSLTEYDCLTISASLEAAGLAVEIGNRRSAASIHDACVLHDAQVQTAPALVVAEDREALSRIGNPAVVEAAQDLDAAVGMILDANANEVALAVDQLGTWAPRTAEALRRLLLASEKQPQLARKAGGAA